MPRKKLGPAPAASAPLWMATYSDLVSLILIFFILLYSFSTVDASKWRQLVEAFSGTSSIFQSGGGDSVLPETSGGNRNYFEDAEIVNASNEWSGLYDTLSNFAVTEGVSENMLISVTDFEMTIRFIDNILFDSAQAQLKPEATAIISDIFKNVIIDYLPSLEYIRIEGHTDSRPIRTGQFRDNWDLSTARASSVHRFILSGIPEVDPAKLFYGGYGEYHPIAPNDTPENLAQNRRVDLVLIRPIESFLEEQEFNRQGTPNS